MIAPLLLFFAQTEATSFIRTNQVGYLPDAPKIAVICSLDFPPRLFRAAP